MAIARTQNAVVAVAAGTPVTTSFASTPTEGNLLVSIGRSFTNSFTNGSINGWTFAVGTQTGSSAYIGLWYKVAGAGESKDVALAWTSSTETTQIIQEWGGFTGTPTLDKTANANNAGSASSKTSGTTDTTTASAEVCLAAIGQGNAVTSATWSNSFGLEKESAAHNLFAGSLVVSSTGTYETTLSWTTARVCGGLIATFMGGTPPTLSVAVSECEIMMKERVG
jgi:hypothetical protein